MTAPRSSPTSIGGDVEAGLAQRGDHLQAGGQADLAFGGDAAVQDCDAGHGGHALPAPAERSGEAGMPGRSCTASGLPRGHADAVDFPFQRDAGRGVHAAAHFLAETFEVGRGGACRC